MCWSSKYLPFALTEVTYLWSAILASSHGACGSGSVTIGPDMAVLHPTAMEPRRSSEAVTTGRRTDEWTEILSGVNVGDAVVLDPGNLQSGQDVTVE